MEIKGFITNLGKYNEGALVGKWITFPIDEDELNEVLKEIGCCYYDEEGEYINTGYEEFFFTDWDGGYTGFVEYVSIDRMNEIAESLEAWENDEDLFEAACEIWNFEEVLENEPSDYNLLCDVQSDYDLGYYWVEESGCYDLSNMGNLKYYIDYAKFGQDIRFESNGGYTRHGFIEYVG
jgi:hypothetical protein